MKIETIVTAIIFLCVGFLAGFIYKSQTQSSAQTQAATATAASGSGGSSSSSAAMGSGGSGSGSSINPATGLPNGHPSAEVSEIIQNYERRAYLKPKDPEIPLRLANYLYDKHYFKLAIQWYEKCLTLKPKDLNARTDLGTCYFYTGQPKQAVSQYKKVLAISPHHQATLFNMIVVNMEGTHELEAANKYWRELHQQNPTYPGLKEVKAKLDSMMGSAGSAMKP